MFFQHRYGMIFDRMLLFGLYFSLIFQRSCLASALWLTYHNPKFQWKLFASQNYSFIDAKRAERYLNNKQMHRTYAKSAYTVEMRGITKRKTDASTTMCNAYLSCQKQTHFMMYFFFLSFYHSRRLLKRKKNIRKFFLLELCIWFLLNRNQTIDKRRFKKRQNHGNSSI